MMSNYEGQRSNLKRISALLINDIRAVQLEYKKSGVNISLVEASKILSRRLKNG